ncbi:hypothetical protein FISHEDRAFT_44756 [Fistulina hepatica ATCC 64428]|uniref:SCP domain-containing protein n=1 Tax=Fistulina hepatica ATCC 64428 TaxID=1128425 RepID=A0A0D7AAI7_9AGAR|nr:hypothetical protein FISHEDRAFT_44756 [Fistulina hepatica ATCC 64428]
MYSLLHSDQAIQVLSPRDIDTHLAANNIERAKHDVYDLIWDNQLSTCAQNWASCCIFRRSNGLQQYAWWWSNRGILRLRVRTARKYNLPIQSECPSLDLTPRLVCFSHPISSIHYYVLRTSVHFVYYIINRMLVPFYGSLLALAIRYASKRTT